MRFYRLLLRLYPRSFRNEFGDELTTAFAAQRAGETGLLASLLTAVLAIADVVPNAIAEHWSILSRDLHYTARSLRRTPGFAITAVLVVALGVGANAAAFSVANFVLLKPLPFANPDQVVKLWEVTPGYGQMELSPGNFKDWKNNTKSFSAMGAFSSGAANLTGSGEPRRLQATIVTADVFPLLGVHAFLGRSFVASDTVAAESVILSYDLWQTQFGGEHTVLGKRIELDGKAYSVIGVMPADFRFPTRDTELWSTMQFTANDFADRANNYVEGIARLRDGVTVEQALAEVNVVATQLERQFPKMNANTKATLYRYSDDLSDRTRMLLYGLCGAALCILLLACANLANLLLVRAMGREREISVRTALGAGRERLVRQLVTESVVLVAAGVIAGVLVAVLALPALSQLVPSSLPLAQQPQLDVRMLIVAGLLIAVTGVGFGVGPALRGTLSMNALREGSRAGGGRKQQIRAALVMVEVMASVVLLVSSGLLVRAMWRLQSQDTGFRAEGVLTLRTALPTPKYGSPATRQVFYSNVLRGVRALPGVSSAAYVSGLPMAMRGGVWNVQTSADAGVRDASKSASLRFVTPQYFSTLSIPLRHGRDVEPTDDTLHTWVAVVSESFVKKYWPDEEPLGKHFRFAGHDRMIVGVVGDIRVRGLERPSEPQVYVPAHQVAADSLTFYMPKDLAIRTSTPTAALLPQLRRIVHESDPLQPISNVQTMQAVVDNDTASRQAQLRILGILAAIALLLSSIGIHGLISFAVSRRTQEIGVRVALGAQPNGIVRMFLRDGLLLCVGGVLPGLAIAYGAGRAMSAILAGVEPSDPLTITVGVGLCTFATLLGCLLPALRASRIDPIAALRAE